MVRAGPSSIGVARWESAVEKREGRGGASIAEVGREKSSKSSGPEMVERRVRRSEGSMVEVDGPSAAEWERKVDGRARLSWWLVVW